MTGLNSTMQTLHLRLLDSNYCRNSARCRCNQSRFGLLTDLQCNVHARSRNFCTNCRRRRYLFGSNSNIQVYKWQIKKHISRARLPENPEVNYASSKRLESILQFLAFSIYLWNELTDRCAMSELWLKCGIIWSLRVAQYNMAKFM